MALKFNPITCKLDLVGSSGGGSDPLKADKVSGATNGNFAGLDATGNLTDSGYAPIDFAKSLGNRIIFIEQFTGDGVSNTFQTTGAITNGSFAEGTWSAANIVTTGVTDITNTLGKPLYNSANIFTRNRINTVSISAGGLVTLDYIPMNAATFLVYYWYQLPITDRLSNYMMNEFVAKMMEASPDIAANIDVDTTNFGGILTSSETTTQKALDRIDDFAEPVGTAASLLSTHNSTYNHADIALNTAARHAAVTLAANHGLSLTGQQLAMGTPTSISPSSTNSVTGTSHTHALSGVAASWTESKIFYVGKHGNDSNSGLSISSAKLTFASAIAAATALTPGAFNKFTIMCLDSGLYSEDIAIPSYVHVNAANATLIGDHTLSEISILHAFMIKGSITKTGMAGYRGVLIASIIELINTENGIILTSGDLDVDVKNITVEQGTGVIINGAASKLYGYIGSISLTGNNGTGISCASSGGKVALTVSSISELVTTTGTTAISVTAGNEVFCNVGRISADTAVNISAGSLYLYTTTMTGATTNTGGTYRYLTTAVGAYITGTVQGDNFIAGGVGTDPDPANCRLNAYDTVDGYIQIAVKNLSNGTSASTDFVATCDDGTDSDGYVDLGINGSGYSAAGWTINGARDSYLYSKAAAGGGGNFAIGTSDAGKNLVFFTGGTLLANKRLEISDTNTTILNTLVIGSLTGLLKGTSGTVSAAVAGTDYTTPSGIENLTNKTLDNTNTVTLFDNKFTLQAQGAATKQAIFSLANITAGQTRTITVPDRSITLDTLSSASGCSITGILKSNGGSVNALSAATAGTDYISGGVGANTQVAYFTASGVLSGNTDFIWDGTRIITAESKGAKLGHLMTYSGGAIYFKDSSANNIGKFAEEGTFHVFGTGSIPSLSGLKISAYDTGNTFIQNNIMNLSSGTSASSDWIATADNGTDSTNYIDMGINSSGWSSGTWTINGADDGYLYTMSGNLAVGTASATKTITLFTGGTLVSNARATVSDTKISTTVPMEINASAGNYIGVAGIFNSTKLATDLLFAETYVTSGGVRAATFIAESRATSNTSVQIQGLNCFSVIGTSSTANFTATAGGLRNRYACYHRGTGTLTSAFVISGMVSAGDTITGNISPVTNARFINAENPVFLTASTMTNYSAFHVAGGAVGSGGTITNRYGLYIEDLVGGTNRWGVYQVGSTDSNYFAGVTTIGVTSQTPVSGTQLHVTGNRFLLDAFATAPTLTTRRANGTYSAPTAVAANDSLGDMVGYGYGTTAYSASGRAFMSLVASEAFTDTAQGTHISFWTTTNGTTKTSEKLRINNDGRIYGTALHNNAGAVTGATNQYIASGTYTPTLTNVTNVAASTARQCSWMRIGNVVTVSGQVDIDLTSTGASSELGMSLPIASALTTAYQCGGTAHAVGVHACWSIQADAANDRARFQSYGPTDSSNLTYTFSFTYEVL